MALNEIVSASMALLLDNGKGKNRSKLGNNWIRSWLLKKRAGGTFHTIFKELKEKDADGFKGYIRMDVNLFDHLVELLKPSIFKQGTTTVV